MEIENESNKLKEKLLQKPNHFDWSELSKQAKKEAREHIWSKPYPCDDCGDIYNKNDLINHFGQGYKICRNCINEYFLMYKGNN